MTGKEFNIPDGLTPWRGILIVGFGILFLTATAFPKNDRNILEQDRIYHNASGPMGNRGGAGGAVTTADIVA